MKMLLGAATALTMMTSGAMAQDECASDSESIDCALKGLYDVISGPAGEDRDWDRMRAMFLDGAIMAMAGPGPDGEGRAATFSVEEYIERSGPWLIENGFVENETRRMTHQYGELATVMSAYEGFNTVTDNLLVSGINTIVLTHVQGEWKIATVMWRHASEDWPVERGYEPVGDHHEAHHGEEGEH